ncbi:MAG TPA: polyphosphate kinase 2 family protein [Acetobacteraceae bacterium]|nr:polyphosphate kinase 2 family protein [Acetobacteraceae bacterium]
MDFRKEFRVPEGGKLRLRDIDPAFKGRHESAESAKEETELCRGKLAALQTLLYAERKHAVLIVLQAMDAGGKDGTIGHVFDALNPQGARVAEFKVPTQIELAHDFLWRVHPEAPAKGEIVIFNRSHYEDVLVTRVHGLIDRPTWEARYERIREFESLLAGTGTTILKFFLHISKQEQLARFAQRLDDPARNWKISEADYKERESWDAYMAAYEEALAKTSLAHAPWYVVPANHKWFRNLAVSAIVVATLEELGMRYPAPAVDLARIRREYHDAVKEEKAEHRHG